jgi:translocation and assembly module TamB
MSSDSPWPDILASKWQAEASGDLTGLDIKSLRVIALDGETIASGRLDWSPELRWKADISASDIDPASLFPQWPGQLKAKVSSSGQLKNGQLQIDADIKQIAGSLRNYPVSLQSKLQWREDHLQISQLNYQSGKSRLKMQGQLGETLKLNWTLNSSDLAELYPQARGELQAQGKLTGAQKKPLIEATVKGSKLGYEDIEIATLEAAFAVDLQHWQKVDIQLSAQTLKLYNYKLESLLIDTDDQQLQAQLVSKDVSAILKLAGQPGKDGWSGQVESVEIKSDLYDNWQLQSPTKISFSETAVQLDTLCMHDGKQASLCAEVNTKNSAWHSRLQINSFPLQLFGPWMPAELKLESLAEGTVEMTYQPAQLLLAEIDIRLPAGAINYPRLDGENDRREYRSGKLQLSLKPQGMKAVTALSMANDDNLQLQLELPGYNPLALRVDQPLKADARIHARDLRLLESFIPEIDELQGEFTLKLDASGTLERPLLIGQANIVNGALQIPRLGLNIKELSLYSQSEKNQKFNFRLSANSGEGKLRISGQTLLDQKAGWPTEINIEGENVEVASIPEARLQASPDLQIKLKNRNIDIKGEVHIPYAKLQPKDFTQAATVSSDAVIIGGEQTAEEKWLITTSVRLTLGERVHFYGFGFEGRLGGSLLLEDEPGQLTRATGEINIPEGNYRAYGQRLEVEHGRAIYTGSPLSNPGLDLRAVRKVNDVTAGLNVTGTLSQPKLDIFSSPAMGQTDALAYLILGRPLESADNEDGNMMAKAALALGLSGGDVIARSLGDRFGLDEMRVESSDQGDQAALVVGRYLSPRLYASYGVGLIESINTLTLRYQISKKWLIKAESGGYQGADILYTIER